MATQQQFGCCEFLLKSAQIMVTIATITLAVVTWLGGPLLVEADKWIFYLFVSASIGNLACNGGLMVARTCQVRKSTILWRLDFAYNFIAVASFSVASVKLYEVAAMRSLEICCLLGACCTGFHSLQILLYVPNIVRRARCPERSQNEPSEKFSVLSEEDGLISAEERSVADPSTIEFHFENESEGSSRRSRPSSSGSRQSLITPGQAGDMGDTPDVKAVFEEARPTSVVYVEVNEAPPVSKSMPFVEGGADLDKPTTSAGKQHEVEVRRCQRSSSLPNFNHQQPSPVRSNSAVCVMQISLEAGDEGRQDEERPKESLSQSWMLAFARESDTTDSGESASEASYGGNYIPSFFFRCDSDLSRTSSEGSLLPDPGHLNSSLSSLDDLDEDGDDICVLDLLP